MPAHTILSSGTVVIGASADPSDLIEAMRAAAAIDIVKRIGSFVCPGQWSKHDQPEYSEEADHG